LADVSGLRIELPHGGGSTGCFGRGAGGPASGTGWMQMLADVSGLRIELPHGGGSTGCFGRGAGGPASGTG
ncbi:hypothetical protein VS872_22615, partial [Salmonella enterica subsp. enterica serovar Paratyphi A]|nr:hypothetical protein [Salmonella enterica subsp. enterica serovar Paratyphi A]